jgi:hypothetical protein
MGTILNTFCIGVFLHEFRGDYWCGFYMDDRILPDTVY